MTFHERKNEGQGQVLFCHFGILVFYWWYEGSRICEGIEGNIEKAEDFGGLAERNMLIIIVQKEGLFN